MPVYHFNYNYSCERKRGGGSSIIVNAITYDDAFKIVGDKICKRPNFTGDLDDYKIMLEWIESEEDYHEHNRSI